MLSSILFRVVYGMQVTGEDDQLVQAVEEAMAIAEEYKVPGAVWVDFAPVLRHIPDWVPGAKFKQIAARARPLTERMRNQGFDYVKSGKVCLMLGVDALTQCYPVGLTGLHCVRNHPQTQPSG